MRVVALVGLESAVGVDGRGDVVRMIGQDAWALYMSKAREDQGHRT